MIVLLSILAVITGAGCFNKVTLTVLVVVFPSIVVALKVNEVVPSNNNCELGKL